MKKEQVFQGFCQQVLYFNSSIRFVGIADEHGSLLAVSERKGLNPLLNPEERS